MISPLILKLTLLATPFPLKKPPHNKAIGTVCADLYAKVPRLLQDLPMIGATQGCVVFYGINMTIPFRPVTKRKMALMAGNRAVLPQPQVSLWMICRLFRD
jgi:hypothetical protein